MKTLTALVLSLGLAAASVGSANASPASPAKAAPRLIVVIAVDQMSADHLVRFRPLFKGGLKTLIEKGAIFSNARYLHANSETGPGHSVILSGRNARHSGIVANGWFDEALGRPVNVVDDPTVVPLGGSGRGASPAHFIGFTLGDMQKRANAGSKVVGVALKDRAAIMMAGPRADAAYWYEAAQGRFITSSHYMKASPAWLDVFNERKLPDAYGAKPWTRLLDEAVYLEYAGQDHVATEADLKDTVFPHVISAPPGTEAFYASLRRTPSADELTIDVALAAVDAHGLGTDDSTDILALGLSASDYIGHSFGPDSHEVLDQMLRLDAMIARLFREIQSRVGATGALFVLTSDHGVMPLAETLQKKGVKASRVKPADLQAAGLLALEKRFPGAKDLVASYMAPDFYLNLEAVERAGLRRGEVERTLGEAMIATGVVANVYTAASFAADPPPPSEDSHYDAVRRSYFASRSPHVIARLKEHMYLTSSPGGTGHGSPYDYDRNVPLVFMGPGIRPGTYEGEAGPEDIAVTLGVLLGLDYPLQDARRRLTEMIQP